MNVWCT